MIRELFQADKPEYIDIEGEWMILGKKRRTEITARIHSLNPVRKRFHKGRLVCSSMNGTHGKGGVRCALCSVRGLCLERLRLHLLVEGLENESRPAILEVGASSFEALEAVLGGVDSEALTETPVLIALERDHGRVLFRFKLQ